MPYEVSCLTSVTIGPHIQQQLSDEEGYWRRKIRRRRTEMMMMIMWRIEKEVDKGKGVAF